MAVIRETAESAAMFIREFLDSFSLSGGIIFLFSFFICVGIMMQWRGVPGGDEIWKTFTTALTTFVSGKKIAESEIAQDIKEKLNGQKTV